jgi:tRNA dimethylallyltransferase
VDPASAARLHPNDVRRVVRALEVWQLTGRPISAWQQQWGNREQGTGNREQRTEEGRRPADGVSSLFPVPRSLFPLAFWLDLPRPELYARINRRAEQMVVGGLVEEVRALRQLPQPVSREARQALGYKEMFDHLDGHANLADTVTRIQTRTRNFAKRQITWFRHLAGCLPIQPDRDMMIDICRLAIDNTN